MNLWIEGMTGFAIVLVLPGWERWRRLKLGTLEGRCGSTFSQKPGRTRHLDRLIIQYTSVAKTCSDVSQIK